MLKNIIECLQIIENEPSEAISIAKGKYLYPETFKSLKKAIKTLKNDK